MTHLQWLPAAENLRSRLAALAQHDADIWEAAMRLARTRLDFVGTNRLDAIVQARHGNEPPTGLAAPPVRLAILGSSTTTHLHAPIRVAGLRRNLWITTYENDYGQYWQDLTAAGSALHLFRPNAILFVFDAAHIARGVHAGLSADETAAELAAAKARILQCWQAARDAFNCPVMQQAFLNVFPPNLGSNEQRLPGSPHRFIAELNAALRTMADDHGVDLVALDDAAASGGLAAWHDPALWCRAKQEISPAAGPGYGELVARVIAARAGRSCKCLVLDLDNTLWGGVIGDDGMAGIVIGQGSPLGEGFVSLQAYCRELARRGIILAVCSKNDDAIAREPFDKHPDMVLRLTDIAAFHANWDDKPSNIERIAADLNIGLDSLVFLDDNPFERNLVRARLPMVAVPEVPDEPALIPGILAAAGYFESVGITEDDRRRSAQYQENRVREQARAAAGNIDEYLASLDMRLAWKAFDPVGRQRIVQLINKTNQFNLTTRRYTDEEVQAIMDDPDAFGLQLRLFDKFGDNGIIAIVIGRKADSETIELDTWLMSCRVLGRQVEAATLNLVVDQARARGARRLRGRYLPTTKNAMVRDHYVKLGFTRLSGDNGGASVAELDITRYEAIPTFISVIEG